MDNASQTALLQNPHRLTEKVATTIANQRSTPNLSKTPICVYCS